MTHSQAVGISTGCALFGGAALSFLMLAVPPQMNGEPNFSAVTAFILSAALFIGGVAALFIRLVHQRRTALAGGYEVRKSRQPAVALRQGALIGVGTLIVLTLAYIQILDVAYFIVTFVILILIEVLIQSRQ